MSFKYRWKNGAPPSRDQVARSNDSLLDESQFDNKEDHEMAEEMARKQLNVPTRTADADRSILPQAVSGEQADMNEP